MTRVLMPASLLYPPSDGGKEAKIKETDVREAKQASAEQNTSDTHFISS